MAGSFTDSFENSVLNYVFSGTALPSGNYEIGLFTTAPTDSTAGSECSGGSYARQAATWTVSTSGQVSNSADITFPTATASWGTVVAVGVFKGTTLAAHADVTAKQVAIGDTVKIAAGDLDINLD